MYEQSSAEEEGSAQGENDDVNDYYRPDWHIFGPLHRATEFPIQGYPKSQYFAIERYFNDSVHRTLLLYPLSRRIRFTQIYDASTPER